MVDTSEDQVFIAVYHDINSTHLYLSEVEGLNYTLSLNYLLSPPESDWIDGYPGFDLHVVSLKGVWLGCGFTQLWNRWRGSWGRS